MEDSRKQALLKKYLNNNCSREELEELLTYLKAEEDEAYEEITADLWKRIGQEKLLEEETAQQLFENAINSDKDNRERSFSSIRWYRIAAAAMWILALGIGIKYLVFNKTEQPTEVVDHPETLFKNDIKPGGTKAFLSAGNTKVVLNKTDTSFSLAGNKVSIQQGDVKVTQAKPVQYTLVTPRGGEYSLVLADGTKVWLNAASKLVYPSVFNGDIREVHLSGEAYFDVKTDAKHPFIVHTAKQDIQVLGTELNVEAYPDESKSKTTLVKGKVKVESGKKQVQLRPGQQVVVLKEGKKKVLSVHQADIRQVVAWKEGYFRFNNTNIHEIMRRLARWYDIEVVFEKGVGQKSFFAAIDRDNNISAVLEMMEGTEAIRFKIEGKRVTVMGNGK